MQYPGLCIIQITSCHDFEDQHINLRSDEINTKTTKQPEQASLAGVGHTPPTPPKPNRFFDIATINAKADNYNRPVVPPYRLSRDGRVAINMKRVAGNHLGFNLMRPEAIKTTPIDQGAGAVMTASTDPTYKGVYQQDAALFHKDRGGVVGHATICDPKASNPQVAGPRDRYDLVVFTGYRKHETGTFRFWSTPITVFVNNPKKANASIHSIRIGTPVGGPVLKIKEFFEPMFAEDGKLLVGRMANSNLSDYGFDADYDIGYMIAPGNSRPCDVSRFRTPKPMANLPHEASAKIRYDIAAYPFIDGQGNPIPRTANITGSYPWMDHKAKNLFFFTDDSTLIYKDGTTTKTRFPTRCVASSKCDLKPSWTGAVEHADRTRGLVMMGLWSHGKAVNLDGELNSMLLSTFLWTKELHFGILLWSRNFKKEHVMPNIYAPPRRLFCTPEQFRHPVSSSSKK